MGIFDAYPRYRVATRQENLGAAMDLPFSHFHDFTEQFQSGVLSTFGLGTAMRDFSTPRGVETPNPLIDTLANSSPIVGDLIHGYEGARHLMGTPTTGAPMSDDEYKNSAFFRKDIPYDPGMTVDRAASLATQYDVAQARAYFGAKDPVTTFVANLGGGMLDPVNFVPVFGPAARAAATARLGFVLGHALVGASEAAINTAVFGALTAPIRAKFGDDVSWQASINNIAFSAVAGLIFGAAGGAIGRARSIRTAKAEQAIRMGAETVRNLQDARGMINDAVTSLVTNGEVKLSPSSASMIERMAADVSDRRATVRALETETADVPGSKAGEVSISPTGIRVAVKPEVVELSSLQPATGALQARNRVNNAVSDAQIEDIAVHLDPARLMPNIDASQGSPLVGADNIVDSGNGRVGALKRVYENPAYAAQASAYRAELEKNGYSTEGFQQPVLINRRVTDLSPAARAQFNAEVNGATTSRMSAVELAQLDRQALTDPVLDTLDRGPVTAASNRAFVARFLGNLPQNERASLLDATGNLNADGVRRIENALVAAAYGDVDITAVRKFAEAVDDNTRSIVGALSDVAGDWLRLRRAVTRGEVSADLDQTTELTEALRKLSNWRDQAAREKRPVGTVISEGMAQGDMLNGPTSLPTKLFVRSFYRDDSFTAAASRETIAARLTDLVNASLKAGEPDMLGEAHAATKAGVLKSVYNDISLDRFEADSVADGAAQVGGPGGRSVAGAGEQAGGRAAGAGGGEPATPAERVTSHNDLIAAAPDRTLDELYAVAPDHQALLDDVGRSVAGDGIEWRNPGVKERATAEEKMKRKRYDSTRRMTDVVRGGFVVKTPEGGERVVSALMAKFPGSVDEGWRINQAGYFDRKVLIRFEDGSVGEIQLWHPDMADAKFGEGEKLYTQMRGLAPDDPKFLELLDKQRALYLRAVETSDEAWLPVLSRLVSDFEGGLPASGKASSKAASESLTPESITSAASTASQVPPADTTAQAEFPLMTAGRPSQSKNVVSMIPDNGRPVIDMQEPRPYPLTDGLDVAAKRVGVPEDNKALAEQYGVDPTTGDFAEQSDIEALRTAGRLTPEDEEALQAADVVQRNADTWAETLRVAAACVAGVAG